MLNFDLYLDTVDVEKNKDYAKKFPAEYVETLLKLKEDDGKPTFRKAIYTGYAVEKATVDADNPNEKGKDQLHLTLDIEVNGEHSAAADIFAAEDEAKKKVEESAN